MVSEDKGEKIDGKKIKFVNIVIDICPMILLTEVHSFVKSLRYCYE